MSTKINVCHICNLGMNGKAIFLCNLLEHTDYTKYDVTILNYRAENADVVIERLKKLPVKIVNPDDSSIKSFMNLLDKYFKNNKVDVVHSHNWDLSGLFLSKAKKNNIPVRVVHSHSTAKQAGRYNKIKEFIRDKIIWKILRYMIQINANRFVACSNEAARWLFTSKIIKENNFTVVVNGINQKIFSPPIDTTNRNITEILFTGRLVSIKNPLFAIDVFYNYNKINPNSHLTMIGNGILEAQIKKKINDLDLTNKITLISQSDKMAEYYRNADAFLLPSTSEGLGIVLIEAQACHTKCLTSNQVPLATQCGLVKYLPLELGAEKWACELDLLIKNTNMITDEKALSNYSIENTVKQIDKIYEKTE